MNAIKIRHVAFLAIVLFALVPVCSAQTQLAGDWQGTLSAGGVSLRLVFHIHAATDGTLSATLDSVDQGVNGIPVTTITLKDSKLSLTVDTVHGTYEGAVNKDGSEIDGTWSQGQPLELDLKRTPALKPAAQAAKPAVPSDVDGTWSGTLDAGGTTLHILIKIVNTQDGLTAEMQSPDQSPVWINATSVKRNGAALTIEISGIGVTYEGKLAKDLGSMEGTFTQMGNALPLALTKEKN